MFIKNSVQFFLKLALYFLSTANYLGVESFLFIQIKFYIKYKYFLGWLSDTKANLTERNNFWWLFKTYFTF